MGEQTFRVGELSKMLGVSIQTLRRWDESGKLIAQRTSDEEGQRIYGANLLREKLSGDELNVADMGVAWASGDGSWQPFDSLHSQTSADFNGRISKLEVLLSKDKKLGDDFPLVTSIVGEIGNNSFDHNLGNWPDVMGIFFGYSMKRRHIVLADRGQGVRETLQRVRPELQSHEDALRVAFTEVVSGRGEAQHRGNGLKYVRSVVTTNDVTLRYQSGDAVLRLKRGDQDLNIEQGKAFMRGCLAILTF